MLNGFSRLGTIKEWKDWINDVLQKKGVYVITRLSTVDPTFCKTGTGGWFKGKNPNVSIEELEKKWKNCNNNKIWDDCNDTILYVGRANYNDDNPKAKKCKSTLQSRLKAYMRFGDGKNAGHQGGRYIWQLKDVKEFEVWYKVCKNPETEESVLIKKYNPFANLKRGDID